MLKCKIFLFSGGLAQEAECDKIRMDSKYRADASIADSSREFKMQKAHFDSEVNTKVLYLPATRALLNENSGCLFKNTVWFEQSMMF